MIFSVTPMGHLTVLEVFFFQEEGNEKRLGD